MTNKLTGTLHHVEIYVSDLQKSKEFWGWFLGLLGYKKFQEWEEGISYRLGPTYLCFVQTTDKHLPRGYNRCSTGLNHLAFHGASTDQVDWLRGLVKEKGMTILYDDKYPYASGPGYYALYFEDPDRIKVEVVAPDDEKTSETIATPDDEKGSK